MDKIKPEKALDEQEDWEKGALNKNQYFVKKSK